MTNLADRLRRFLVSWLTLIASLAIAPVVIAVVLEVIAITLPADWDGGRVYAHPIALSVFWAIGGALGGIVFGWPFVLLRRYLIRPDAPFIRAGYLGVAAIPFALAALFTNASPGWYWMGVYAQAFLLVSILIYVGLAWRFGVFELEDPTWWRDEN